MLPLSEMYKSYLEIIKNDCLHAAEVNGIFITEDEAGNIWISEDGDECFRIRGWHTAFNEINRIIKRKELRDLGTEL